MDLRRTLARFYYYVLARRYRVGIKGLEILDSPGAKLFLPNHQSLIDPQLIAVISTIYCDFVPVVSENFFRIPVIRYFLKKWNAVAVSDLEGGNRDPAVLKNIYSKVMHALQNGKSVIIYPSGQIARTPIEKIYNKQSAHVVVSNLPEEVRVIGVRISGLWGSMWSAARTGQQPNFVLTYLKSILYLFANFIFFLPKRPVTFEYVDITEKAKIKAMSERSVFNAYLENFYNLNGPEKATYIRHLFYVPK